MTGATGFVGRTLVPRLLQSGYEVVVATRCDQLEGDGNTDLPDLPVLDIRVDQATLRRRVRDSRIDSCVHLAARFVAEHTDADVQDLVASNIGLTASLADAAASGGVGRFLTLGTVWQHAVGPGYRPVSLYAATKQAAEDVLQHFAHNEGLPVTALKLPDTYGPRDTRGKAVDLLLNAARTGEVLRMSPGEQLLDLVHVDDVVAAVLLALEADVTKPFSSWALSSSQPLTLRELTVLVARLTGRNVAVRWGARPYRKIEAFAPWQAGPLMPGWSPTVSLEDGISALWQEEVMVREA